MIYDIKDVLQRFFQSRMLVLSSVIVLMFGMVLIRVFALQIVNGKEYQENFVMRIEKTLSKEATRGNIYDVNGNILAYNDLAYSVTISDSGSYSSTSQKNRILNAQLAQIVQMLDKNDESLYNSFQISLNEEGEYEFNVEGRQLERFLADVFGKSSYGALKYNDKYGFNEATATADQVMYYLTHDKGWFQVDESYDKKTTYEIVVIRYAMRSTTYSRYKTTTISQDVSDKTVAYVNEHLDEFIGIAIEESTIRKYNDSEYFAAIIGYTGKISDAEYTELSASNSTYTTDDTIGKAGLEQYYESFLRGINGEQIVYVDTVGRIQEVVSSTEPSAGNDLYITIDKELQIATYKLLEQEIAGIVYSNIKSGNITMTDVYFALINNNVIDITQFDDEDATETEQRIYQNFLVQQAEALELLERQFYASKPYTNNEMSVELLDYVTYIIDLLKSEQILVTSRIDMKDSVYVEWKNGRLSPKDYLTYCIAQQWIDISKLDVDSKYADIAESYDALWQFIKKKAVTDKKFAKCIYQYMVPKGEVTGQQLCLVLLEQGALDYDDDIYAKIRNGSIGASGFIMEKINNIEITPAQLALDPCTGSCIITDVRTGEIRALVSYPGYDNNKLANGVDAQYYARLNEDLSNPQWNYATQEKTAPGSTFKMLTAAAGLSEDVISVSTKILCSGVFTNIDNRPTCWIYPKGTHSYENVAEAIRDSCNLFFYTTGYDLSTKDTGVYNDANGIAYIQEYASIFGLDEKTGLEIAESTSSIATEYPVMAAIGQSNNNITTAALARYVTAVATGKLYDYQLMSKVVDGDGNVIVSYEPQYEDISNVLSSSQWSTIRYGMNLMCQNNSSFRGFTIDVAGKTGTAQQVSTRPNHALFVGYAPYNNPEISIATRIAYGYTSSNTASVSKNILSVYFETASLESILDKKAAGANSSLSNSITD